MRKRVLLSPLTLLLVGATAFLTVWKLANLAYTAAIGRAPTPIVDRGSIVAAALVAHILVGAVMQRRPPAKLGLRRQHAMRDLGLGMLIGAGLVTAIVGIMTLCGWYEVTGVALDQK